MRWVHLYIYSTTHWLPKRSWQAAYLRHCLSCRLRWHALVQNLTERCFSQSIWRFIITNNFESRNPEKRVSKHVGKNAAITISAQRPNAIIDFLSQALGSCLLQWLNRGYTICAFPRNHLSLYYKVLSKVFLSLLHLTNWFNLLSLWLMPLIKR